MFAMLVFAQQREPADVINSIILDYALCTEYRALICYVILNKVLHTALFCTINNCTAALYCTVLYCKTIYYSQEPPLQVKQARVVGSWITKLQAR